MESHTPELRISNWAFPPSSYRFYNSPHSSEFLYKAFDEFAGTFEFSCHANCLSSPALSYNQYYDNSCKISESIWICVHFHTDSIALQVKKNLSQILSQSCAKGHDFSTLFGVNSAIWLLQLIKERLVIWKSSPFLGLHLWRMHGEWINDHLSLYLKVSAWSITQVWIIYTVYLCWKWVGS